MLNEIQSSFQRQQLKTTQMISIITIMFAVCNTPAYLLNIWEAIDSDLFVKHPVVAFLSMDISNCLILINSATTFCIYFIFCRHFRKNVKKFLPNLLCCCKVVMNGVTSFMDHQETEYSYNKFTIPKSVIPESALPLTTLTSRKPQRTRFWVIRCRYSSQNQMNLLLRR